jgi:uncharacterized protein (TIGR00159 family)
MSLFGIGFLEFRFIDIIDILIVAYFLFMIFRLLRGTIGFNIIIGVLLLYLIWYIVNILNMHLLSLLLGKFVAFGVLILIIIFQPEIRRFLIFLGRSTLKGRFAIFNRFFRKAFKLEADNQQEIEDIKNAIISLASQKTGALIVFSNHADPVYNTYNGVVIDAKISKELLCTIFNHSTELHDGAVIIANGRIAVASAILPVSSTPDIPQHFGARHRAAIGATENNNSSVFLISEETGSIGFASGGTIETDMTEEQVYITLLKVYNISNIKAE